MIGSEIGFRNPFPRVYTQEYDDYYRRTLEGTTTVDQGGILNVKGEIDFSAIQRFILFLAADWEIQLNDTDFNLGYSDSWSSGAGDGLLQLNLGFSYAFSYSFSIEGRNFYRCGNLLDPRLGHSNFFRFGNLINARLGHSVVLKWSL